MEKTLFVILLISIISFGQLSCAGISPKQTVCKDTDKTTQEETNKKSNIRACKNVCERDYTKCLEKAEGIPDNLKACNAAYKRCIRKCEQGGN